MKKLGYIVLIIVFLAGTAFIIMRYKHTRDNFEPSYYNILDRKGALATSQEWTLTKNKVNNLYRAMAQNPDDQKSANELAALFIQEARITGNHAYYDQAAMQQVNKVLEANPQDFEALTFKALIELSKHHFAEGLATAAKARKINPYNAFIHGLLVDANVEMGNYDSAVANADKMVDLRPDIRSYSRISYLREIYGDYPGAIDAMKMAVEAGLPGEDATEWSRSQLGKLYENTGLIDSAKLQYSKSVFYRKGFAPALAGLGRVAYAEKNYPEAIQLFLEADSLIMDYSIKENLAELYAATNQKEKSDSIYKYIMDNMTAESENAMKDETAGHYADRELAQLYLKVGNNNKALEHALAEWNRRPENIDVNETLAWVYYKMNDVEKANKYIDKALKTNSVNPTLLGYAGLIKAKAGNNGKAKTYLEKALQNNPAIDIELKDECTKALAGITRN